MAGLAYSDKSIFRIRGEMLAECTVLEAIAQDKVSKPYNFPQH